MASRNTPRVKAPESLAQKAAAERKAGGGKLVKTLVMAGTSRDRPGAFVGFDGERRRYAGNKFYWYGEKLPSWCRIQNEKGEWVDVKPQRSGPAKRPEFRRAAPGTVPGQAPKERLRDLVEDERELSGAVDLPEPQRDPEATATEDTPVRASDKEVDAGE